MRHCYKKMVAYNPSDNEVVACKLLDSEMIFDSKAYDEAFYSILMSVDRVTCIIIGVSLTGDMYQLSPVTYGSYIKEDSGSIAFLDKPKLLCAISKYQTAHNLWN